MHKNPLHRHPRHHDPQEHKNMLLAIVLMFAVVTLFNYFYEVPRAEKMRAHQAAQQAQEKPVALSAEATDTGLPQAVLERGEALGQSQRIEIAAPKVMGSLPVRGFRIDDLALKDYYETLDNQNNVALLSPSTTASAYYAEFGLLSSDPALAVPGPDTVWQRKAGSASRLTTAEPVVLVWDNGQGLVFEREISVDDNYVFTVTQRVRNNTDAPRTFYPFSLVSRRLDDEDPAFKSASAMLHEGAVAYLDGELEELAYKKIHKKQKLEFKASEGWLGFGDKYWFVGLIPESGGEYDARFSHRGDDENSRFQADLRGGALTAEAGRSAETTVRFYAGAKELSVLERYENDRGFPHFDLVVDYGWLYFLTKPFMYALHYLSGFFGHFAIGMIVFTVILRTLLFPASYMTSKSMAKMRLVQPRMKELQEKYKNDRERLQKEIYALYKEENVNPLNGCWPQIIQMILFIALYKTLMVTVDMRHVPFWGWIADMSAPDPTHIFNLFGLIPWEPPQWLREHAHISAWACLMGVTMLLIQRLHPPPPDPMMATIMNFMPVMIVFIFSQFPAGLAIYYTVSNALTFGQQYVILKGMGSDVSIFSRPDKPHELRVPEKKKKKKKDAAGP